MIIRIISIVSLVLRTGREKPTPCQPSITCGPLVPMPSRNRPPDMCCRLIADMASIAGVRAPSCAMPVARRTRRVLAAIAASGVNASYAQNSGTQIESTPTRSASRASSSHCGSWGLTESPTVSVMAETPHRLTR